MPLNIGGRDDDWKGELVLKRIKQPKAQVRIMKRDLKDLIRDEIYGADVGSRSLEKYLVIEKSKLRGLVNKLVSRAIIGH